MVPRLNMRKELYTHYRGSENRRWEMTRVRRRGCKKMTSRRECDVASVRRGWGRDGKSDEEGVRDGKSDEEGVRDGKNEEGMRDGKSSTCGDYSGYRCSSPLPYQLYGPASPTSYFEFLPPPPKCTRSEDSASDIASAYSHFSNSSIMVSPYIYNMS